MSEREWAIVIMFVVMLIVGLIVYRKEINFTIRMKNSLRFHLEMIGLATIFGLVVSYLNPNNKGNLIIYFILVMLLPYVRLSNRNSKEAEKLFENIILYCNSMALLLKQGSSVYSAMERCAFELDEPLKTDVRELMDCLVSSKNESIAKIEKMNKKYPYTIIKQLNIIILQFYYQSNESNKRIIDVFESDIEQIVEDVKENQVKRKVIKMEYIGLCVGCMLAMYLLVGQLRNALNIYNSNFVSNLILVYYILVIIVLVGADIYFNSHLSKE